MSPILNRLTAMIILFFAAVGELFGITPPSTPPQDAITSEATTTQATTSLIISPALPSATPQLTHTQRPILSSPTPTASVTPVPPPIFSTDKLIRVASPHTYVEPCRALRLRWDPELSPPGTVAVAIMYHQVVPSAGAITNPNQVADADFIAGLETARRLGFQTITTAQLATFLEVNARIPERSMLLIIDDLQSAAILSQYQPAFEDYGFTATSAYITSHTNKEEWNQMSRLVDSGFLDVQAHGFLHNGYTYIYPTTPEETLHQEIFEPVHILEERIGYRPLAFIWPGGDYTPRAVDLAHEAGYHLGFTVRNRGPMLFNWIPQGDDERKVSHPLLVLPRVWSKDVVASLEQAVTISQEAKQFASRSRLSEQRWYQQYCE